eukprot:7071432-Heterocapsa_arctica.AAC.2
MANNIETPTYNGGGAMNIIPSLHSKRGQNRGTQLHWLRCSQHEGGNNLKRALLGYRRYRNDSPKV